jgi:hypothetical protein
MVRFSVVVFQLTSAAPQPILVTEDLAGHEAGRDKVEARLALRVREELFFDMRFSQVKAQLTAAHPQFRNQRRRWCARGIRLRNER